MREATVLALVFALLLGVAALSQVSTISTSIQTYLASGPLHDFVGMWTYILALLIVGLGVVFVISVGGKSRR